MVYKKPHLCGAADCRHEKTARVGGLSGLQYFKVIDLNASDISADAFAANIEAQSVEIVIFVLRIFDPCQELRKAIEAFAILEMHANPARRFACRGCYDVHEFLRIRIVLHAYFFLSGISLTGKACQPFFLLYRMQ